MNRRIAALMIASAVSLGLAACGGSDSPVFETTASSAAVSKKMIHTEAATIAADEGDPFAELGRFTMVVGHAQPEGNPRTISTEQFAADVAEKTYGHVTVEIHDNGGPGTEKEMFDQVAEGTIQGMRGGLFEGTPRLRMFTLPFLTNSRAQITALLKSELARKICVEAEEQTGTVIISLCDAGGYRQFSNNRHPVTKPEDMVGFQMGTNGADMGNRIFAALGAGTVSIPYEELYAQMKAGAVDGQENPWMEIESLKLYEVQNYFTEVNYQFQPDPFYVNAAWWNGLPQELRTIIQECADQMADYNDRLVDENAAAARQAVIDSGAEIYVPTAEELQAFRNAVEAVYDQCVEAGYCTNAELQELLGIVANAG